MTYLNIIDEQSFIVDFTQSPPKITAVHHYYRPIDLEPELEKKLTNLAERNKIG